MELVSDHSETMPLSLSPSLPSTMGLPGESLNSSCCLEEDEALAAEADTLAASNRFRWKSSIDGKVLQEKLRKLLRLVPLSCSPSLAGVGWRFLIR